MGLYDTVNVPCPSCGKLEPFQSKGAGFPSLQSFTLENAPADVLSNVNRHSPHQCECGRWFAVDEKTRQAIVANEPEPWAYLPINDWYRNNG